MELEKRFQNEWPDFLFADSYKHDTNLPPVLIAIRENQVIGGLAYSYFKEPNGDSDVIWVNALLVLPEWRGQGIASELINRGIKQVSNTHQTHLYVYTNVPNLYQSLDWSIVDIESEPHHKVMSFPLTLHN